MNKTNDSISSFRAKLERRKGQQEQVQKDVDLIIESITDNKKALKRHEKAREVIRQVGFKTQQQLSYNINEITSMALNAVLKYPYDLELEFVERRNKTECDMYFVRDEIRIDPFSGGGGAVDVAAFALRVASWSMQTPRTRNVLVLDEPFKHLKGEEANRKMLAMVQKISKELGLQIIMVSDERVSREATMEATDALFEVSIKKGITKVIKT